jgi:hypothetical protein
MDRSSAKKWIPPALLAGVLYFVVGFCLGTFAGSASSDQSRFGWRLAAWLVSLGIYLGHICYEYFKLKNTPLISSLHLGGGVALGGFLIAISAIVHALSTGSGNLGLLLLALLAFPLVTALPAFVIGFVGTTLLQRISRKV